MSSLVLLRLLSGLRVRRLLRRLDWCCLTNSLFISALLLRSFGATMSWSERLQAGLYPVMSMVQLAVMFWHKDLYQRHRFKVSTATEKTQRRVGQQQHQQPQQKAVPAAQVQGEQQHTDALHAPRRARGSSSTKSHSAVVRRRCTLGPQS